MRTETSPVERAYAGRCPVFAVTVGALDDLKPWVRLDGGLVGARFVIPSAIVAPG